MYKFKAIGAVPSSMDMIDTVLSKTNRTTPTVVHPGYAISRIRKFYLRKIKFVAQEFHDALARILEQFPNLNSLHPFWKDQICILYDADHWKLALGQLNTCRSLIDNIAKDYVRLLKYGDSLYRCKSLKRSALGRMCTLVKKNSPSLAYLEQVRQHLSRLPSIDPNTRTLLICGYPNVGKSSFINRITRADVEVQSYAFTTKTLLVGHTDYRDLRWQVIDSPGILDHPLEQRNTIEMQSITALAHLRAAILFLIDISEQCGYTIKQQLGLFESIRPLFANKPLVVVLNKVDIVRVTDLPEDDKQSLMALKKDGILMVEMSNVTVEGVAHVKQMACDALLQMRVERKLKSRQADSVLNRIHVAGMNLDTSARRPPVIPPSVRAMQEEREKEQAMAEEDQDQILLGRKPRRKGDFALQSMFYEPGHFRGPEDEPGWDPTNYSIDYRKNYMLANDDWKFDNIPEILDGKNVADYVDPDILEKLQALEAEEEALLAAGAGVEDDSLALNPLDQARVNMMRNRKHRLKLKAQSKKHVQTLVSRRHRAARDPSSDMKEHLSELGVVPDAAVERVRDHSRSRSKSRKAIRQEHEMNAVAAKRARSQSRGRVPGEEGISSTNKRLRAHAVEGAKRDFKKLMGGTGRKGEGDKLIPDLMPKHLYSGKRGSGKTDRR